MKIYWSARRIPELKAFKATDRALIIQLAARSMPLPRRFLTKTLQLVVLIALFWQLISVESWLWRILALLAAGLFYPLLLHPLTLNLSRPYLPQAARDYRAMQEEKQDSAD
ncbi:hypothetical protein CWE09_06460 [Aliidiomarina minuta]|uniref:Uncharacterized protein n=1 Tax=Aliidiomarina minuta TaxID=880057 RepID=A0A432W9R4_9GAMM|nr:DUF6170 family protein [Aliidiomarina minuta]RUO26348.1 hypothetical protein CWE09_06460 [Aliidiomarina minuta]